MAASNTEPQFATKKRCRMCNSSNPVAATTCDICGCAFEQAVFVNAGSASAAVVHSPSVGASAASAQADAKRMSQPPPTSATQPNAGEPRRTVQQRATRAEGQSAGRAKAPPKAPTGGAKRPSATADMAQFLRGADDPGVAAQPTWSPMLAWVVVSFVVLVFAVVATAILVAGSTVSGLTR